MSQDAVQFGIHSLAGSNGVPRILVVDDEQHMCDICTRTLRRTGYEVFATADPNVAVHELRNVQQFDLLLTDIKMPVMSGLDLAQIAHEHDPTIAIIIMTGFASMENLQQSVQRGVADFLSKPFELDQLRLAVDQALHKRTILQDNLRLRTVDQLLQDSQKLNATLDISELAQTVLQIALEYSHGSLGFVFIADEQHALKLMALQSSELLADTGRALARRAYDEQRCVIGEEDLFLGNDSAPHQVVAIPLRAQSEVNGVILLQVPKQQLCKPVVQETLSLFANYAGASLRNAYLYSKLGELYQRQQEVDRLKSEFISIASHELRTPLSIVLGYTMMVRDQSDSAQREYLQRVLDNAQRIKDIIDDMVSLRHIETGETTLTLESVSLQSSVEQSILRMQPALESRPQHIVVELPTEPIWLYCDHEKLILILSHLISNAIKFTPEGGRVTIRASLRPAGALDSGDGRIVQASRPLSLTNQWVVVEIQDTGIGIPEREQSRIFDRFYQVADSLTRDHGGTGLGLTLARELVGTLGGAIWLTSQEGQGSTFTFALPYHQDQATNGSASTSV